MGQFIVWRPAAGQQQEDGRRFRAHSPEDAAQAWAEREDYEGNEYSIVGGVPADVMVLDTTADPGSERLYRVSGQSLPVYSARPAPSDPDGDRERGAHASPVER